MMELHPSQIDGMNIVIKAVENQKLGVTLSAIGLPSTCIEERNGTFLFTVTKNGPDGLDVSHLFDSTDDRLRSYLVLILTIKQLQRNGYLDLVEVGVPKMKYSFIDISDKEPKCIEIIDEEILSFLKENFYKSIFLTNELIDYINTRKTREQRMFDLQMTDTEKKHNEAMRKAEKTLCYTRLAFFIAFITSMTTFIIGICEPYFEKDKAIYELNNSIRALTTIIESAKDTARAKAAPDTIDVDLRDNRAQVNADTVKIAQ